MESRSSYSSETNAIAAVAKGLGVTPETLRRWRNQSDTTVSAESKRSAKDSMAEFIGMLDDIRAVAADCGFAATVKAVETVINAGRTVDRAAIGTCAKRILEGAGTEGGQDLKRYDKYMKEAE